MPRSSQFHFQAGAAPNLSLLLSENPVSEIRVGWVSYNPPKAWLRHVESCPYTAAIPHLIRKGHKDPHTQGINKGAVAGTALGGLDTGIGGRKTTGRALGGVQSPAHRKSNCSNKKPA